MYLRLNLKSVRLLSFRYFSINRLDDYSKSLTVNDYFNWTIFIRRLTHFETETEIAINTEKLLEYLRVKMNLPRNDSTLITMTKTKLN